MEQDLIDKIVARTAREAGLPVEQVAMDSSFEALGIDSLTAMALIGELEDDLNVQLSNEEIMQIRTVRDAIVNIQVAVDRSSAA